MKHVLAYTEFMQNPDSTISLIAAISAQGRALGKDGQLLWQIPDDLKRFKEITSGHPVIMGRKTWESLPEKFRPLPGRLNIVVTRQEGYEATGAEVCGSLEDAVEMARAAILLKRADAVGTHGAAAGTAAEEIFIIGGGELYKEALPFADKLYLTLIDEEKDGDTFFPEYEQTFTKILSEESREYNNLKYRWVDLARA
jgi:dihydrofolate reductase